MALTEVPIELSSTPGIIDNSTGTAITIDSSNNTNFADNSKAIFGAGSDLQIYHDGSNSYIDDAGTGELLIRGSAVTRIQSYIGEDMIVGVTNGPANLYYDAAKKLATTATGIDVTGSVTASDGVFTDGSAGSASVFNEDGTTADFRVESTGNTHMLFVDGGLNRVGIGTSSPDYTLDLGGATPVIRIGDAGSIQPTLTRNNSTGGLTYDTTGQSITSLIEFKDNGSERMRIDSSGNVGIGTTTVGQFSATSVGLTVDSGNAYSGIAMTDGATTSTLAQGYSTTYLYNQANGSMLFGTNNTEAMRIDASGNVGIGAAATSFGSGVAVLQLTGTASGSPTRAGALRFRSQNGTSSVCDIYSDNGFMSFYTGSSTSSAERMRIDASGNLLVNRTSVFTTAKMEIQSDAGDASTLALNSIDTDGSILEFYRAGATVGSIGSISSDLYIAESNSGLRFDGENNQILPSSTTASTDGTCNLGAGTARFKDLHLSQYVIAHQGAFLGGNASANYLDEYEEGDYDCAITCGTSGTISLNGSFNRAAYTKVGRLVTVHGFIVVSAVSSPVGYFTINLPFTPASLTDRAGDSTASLVLQNIASANISDFMGTVNEGDAKIYVQLGDNTAIQNDSAQQIAANTYIHFSTTYSAV